jgi:hypothetical protein
MIRNRKETAIRDKIFLKLFVKDKFTITQEEINYFRKHPDEIDEITAPLNVHKFFLLIGILLGVLMVAGSKILKFSSILYFQHGFFEEFVVDIIFEIGVALIGAGVTAYFLGILLNMQQENATKWRDEIRKQIRETDTLPT